MLCKVAKKRSGRIVLVLFAVAISAGFILTKFFKF